MDEIFEGCASPLDLVEYLVCGASVEASTRINPKCKDSGCVFTLHRLDLRNLELRFDK